LLAQRIAQVKLDYTAASREPRPQLAYANQLCACRLTGAPFIDMTGFETVAAVLSRHRLLRKGRGDEAGWRFRHDRIMDWLILPAFAAAEEANFALTRDPRFAAACELRRFAMA
jgi:hypothetical protein